jgi:hypothetical protein
MEERHGLRSMRRSWEILLILLLAASPAWATLGQPESTVNNDVEFLHGQTRDEARTGYRLHVITDPGGTVVREYISPAGIVFGISWQGPFLPNMQQILGTYFSHLQAYALAQTGRRGGPMTIQKENFVLISGGHMRAYRGHAYVPKLLPPGVSPEVVQ